MLGPLALALMLAAPDLSPGRSPGPSRIEHFVLEEVGDQGPVPVAVIGLRRVPTGGGLLLEQEFLFSARGLRVLVSEVHGSEGLDRNPCLVWRELRTAPGVGRTWLAEWDARTGQVRTANHGTRGPVHGALPGPEPTWPLALIEDLRAGGDPGQVETLDPLTRARCVLTVTVRRAGTRRTAELRRADGTLAGRYGFDGDALVSLQLQEGARVARPCEVGEYRRLLDAWRVRHDPLGELRDALRAMRVGPR